MILPKFPQKFLLPQMPANPSSQPLNPSSRPLNPSSQPINPSSQLIIHIYQPISNQLTNHISQPINPIHTKLPTWDLLTMGIHHSTLVLASIMLLMASLQIVRGSWTSTYRLTWQLG